MQPDTAPNLSDPQQRVRLAGVSMADLELRVLNRSARPLRCEGNTGCQNAAVASVVVTMGLLRSVETRWCLACLDGIHLPSVLALLNMATSPELARARLIGRRLREVA